MSIICESIRFEGRDSGSGVREKEILPNAIPGVHWRSVSATGPASWRFQPGRDEDVVLLFVGGRGSFRVGSGLFAIEGGTIARAPVGSELGMEVAPGDRLDFLCIRKELTSEDREDLTRYPENNAAPWVRKFSDCEAYREAIKSPGTVSRTLLPANHVPRVALGTVETTGPDRVAEHRHPMLEQVFLGLQDNDITVHADGMTARLREHEVLLIPHGSQHGVTVETGRRLHYVWMDFFSDRAGQAWLDMHQPIISGEQPRIDG